MAAGNKKILWVKIAAVLIVIILGWVLFFWGVIGLPKPGRARLCRDLEDFIPRAECMKLHSDFEIVTQAFPAGTTTSGDIRSALGDYFVSEKPAVYGSLETYHLNVRRFLFFVVFSDAYLFRFDHDGKLISFRYED